MLFYIVGIKGSGMSSLAKILIGDGHIVRGVDVKEDFYTTKNLNISIDTFDNMRLSKSYFYIIGNAYKEYSLIKYLKLSKYHYLFYPEFINYYFKDCKIIAVAASHGKTTCTSMLAHIMDSSYALVGNGYGRSGKDILFLEACEYKDTFLNYSPDISLILNIDYDHPDYFLSEDEYASSFIKFSLKSKLCIINNDDYNSKRFKTANIITYGINNSDIIFDYEVIDDKTIVSVLNNKFIINFPGKHYAYDFMGVYMILKLLGVSDDLIKDKLNTFKLPYRRFLINNINSITYILDYAHHPTEIKAFYESVKCKYKDKKIVLFFEFHTYSRTITFKNDFSKAFNLFDSVYLLPVFTSVREQKDSKTESFLVNYFRYDRVRNIDIIDYKYNNASVYCFLGAGMIDKVYNEVIDKQRMNH